MQHSIMETISKTLVRDLQTNYHDLAQGGVLFREAKFVLETMFSSWSVVHVSRFCNTVAHNLACSWSVVHASRSSNKVAHNLARFGCDGTRTIR